MKEETIHNALSAKIGCVFSMLCSLLIRHTVLCLNYGHSPVVYSVLFCQICVWARVADVINIQHFDDAFI